VRYKLHTRERLVFSYQGVENYIGKIEVVYCVINSGRKLTISVKFKVNVKINEAEEAVSVVSFISSSL